jgi:hypothetical protein
MVVAAVAGFGAFSPVVAFDLAGAGHGWLSALAVSWIALFASPLASVALIYPERRWARVLSVLLLVVLTSADGVLAWLTYQESYYFWKVWSLAPGVVCVFLVAWLAPQMALTLSLMLRKTQYWR